MSTAKKSPRLTDRPSIYQRQSLTLHYQTFPTAPPKYPGPPGRKGSKKGDMRHDGTLHRYAEEGQERRQGHSRNGSRGTGHPKETPLPMGQMAILAVIALAEQTALNSISPYLPEMAATFPDVGEGQVGLCVGLIASAFALAQFTTNFLWGWLSDRIGRKPIVLMGTLLTACCFVAFGLCTTLWQAVVVQALMGLVNGNQAVISTCIGEITDRSNQSRAFTYLPVIYGLGGITGPMVGGLLVMHQNPLHPHRPNPYPYLPPNLFSAAILIIDMILTIIFLRESLECAKDLPPLGKRVGSLFSWIWQFTSSYRPTYLRRSASKAQENHHARAIARDRHANEESSLLEDDDEDEDDGNTEVNMPHVFPETTNDSLTSKIVFQRDTILLLATFLIFQLSNISYNNLYPIFAQANPPTGRHLSPEEIGISLAFAGVIAIIFQIGVFGRLREKVGNKITYCASLAGFVIAFLLMPWVGYKDGTTTGHGEQTQKGKVWLWIELGAVLIIKTVSTVGGLTSSLLLITNSAPSHAVLGTLNGLAQTLSAAGRAIGPFISGTLFTAATRVQPKGEALAFSVFGGISFLGCLLSFGIRGPDLESDDYDEYDEEECEDENHGHSSPERPR